MIIQWSWGRPRRYNEAGRLLQSAPVWIGWEIFSNSYITSWRIPCSENWTSTLRSIERDRSRRARLRQRMRIYDNSLSPGSTPCECSQFDSICEGTIHLKPRKGATNEVSEARECNSAYYDGPRRADVPDLRGRLSIVSMQVFHRASALGSPRTIPGAQGLFRRLFRRLSAYGGELSSQESLQVLSGRTSYPSLHGGTGEHWEDQPS